MGTLHSIRPTRTAICPRCTRTFTKQYKTSIKGVKHYCSYACGARDQPEHTINVLKNTAGKNN